MSNHASATASPEGVRVRGDRYSAEAGWFGPEDRPRFGWLYQPDVLADNGVGIVIVPPFGREEICAHRTLRHLAEEAAKTGFVAVRFDLDGTGDSAGADTDPDRVGAWLASIADACDLARGAGAAQLVLVGVRLGATLAALAAPRRKDVAALVAFNAVISGKMYLRELRAFQLAMNLQPAPVSVVETGQETSGFLLTEATCATLKAIDLAGAGAAPAPIVHVLERDDLPDRKAWPEHLQSLRVETSVQRVPGYVEMLDDPHANRIARAFIDASIDCARSLPKSDRDALPAQSRQRLRSRITLGVDGTAILEEVVTPGTDMFGIFTQPIRGDANHAVLMLNAGAIRHIGSNRVDVSLSRRLAAAGLCMLRADLPGIGDSPARKGETENIVYGPRCVEDVGVLVTWLRANCAGGISAGGMCSGAYHALRAAIAGQAIDSAYLINCLAFGPTVESDPEGSGLLGDIAYYDQAMRSVHAWRRLFTGKIAFGAVARVAFWHLANHGKRAGRKLARWLRIPLRNDLGSDLLALAHRGGRMHFLFSANETGLALLASEAGSVVPKLCRTGQFEMQVLKGPDHTFTQRWAQALLLENLIRILSEPGERNPQAEAL